MIGTLLRMLVAQVEAAETPRFRVADRYADVPLTNQFGRALRFRRDLIRGRAILVNAMFTKCRGTCPGTSEKIRELRTALSPVFGRRLSFASFTLEPEVDTPERLRAYAARYGADVESPALCDWHFLGGAAADIEALRRSLGLYDLNPAVDADITQHGSVLLFGNDQADRWSLLPSDLRTGLLTETIRRVAGFTFEQRYGIRP